MHGKMKAAALLLPQLFLGAPPTSTRCLALSPLVLHGPTGIAERTRRPSSARHGVVRRRHPAGLPSLTSASTTELYMVGSGGSYAPEPERPLPTTRQTRWEEYVVPDLEVPTKTEQEPRPMAQMPPRPKIVVFGASGRIGRRIVKKLLGSGVDLDVVAFVRNAKKLETVLYDEEDLAMESMISNGGGCEKRGNGPRLHVVEADVVSQRDVYRRNFETNEETEALDGWVTKAKRYFADRGWNYDNSTEIKSFEDDDKVAADVDVLESGGEEALREAIAGSTVLISCLGTHRPSNPWTDYLRVPVLRVFRRNASRWCSDPRHPYYVNYLSTKKILEEAEREQQRRDALSEFERERRALEEQLERMRPRKEDEEGFSGEVAARLAELRKKRAGLHRGGGAYSASGGAVGLPSSGRRLSTNDRIKFIRISHLMVGRSPFRLWNAVTNILWSQLSKYETIVENLCESCKSVDTIVLRPGDLTDEERNTNHTSLQLSVDGKVPYPSNVGREDVAELAAVAALTKTSVNNTDGESSERVAHHYTWAIRWAGQHLSPPQGLRPDGLESAALCFIKAVKEQNEVDKERRLKERRIKSYHWGRELIRLRHWRRKLRPYVQSLAISVPLYTSLTILAWYLFGNAFIDLATRIRRLKF